jgi:hypothetical protein
MKPRWLEYVLGPPPPSDGVGICEGHRIYRLKTDLAEAWFTASIQARWLSADPGHEALVFRHLRDVGNGVTCRYSVLDPAVAQDALNATLSALREIPGAGIQGMSAHAALSVAQEDLHYAERSAAIQRDQLVDIAKLESKHEGLTRLRDLFLSDGTMARLWWFDGDRERFLRLAEHDGKFDTIVSMFAATEENATPARRPADLTRAWCS